MYFLGKLEKLLEGDIKEIKVKAQPPTKEPKKEYSKKPYEKKEYNSSPPRKQFTEEEKKEYYAKKDAEKNSQSSQNFVKPVRKQFTEEKKKEYYANKNAQNSPQEKGFPKDMCYVLWASTGNSFEAMYGDKKRVTFKLAGIDPIEKNQSYFYAAKNFLDEKIKKKSVYLDFKGTEGDVQLVEVFTDKNKTNSVNKMVMAEGFSACQVPVVSKTHSDEEQEDMGWDVPESASEVTAPPVTERKFPRFPK